MLSRWELGVSDRRLTHGFLVRRFGDKHGMHFLFEDSRSCDAVDAIWSVQWYLGSVLGEVHIQTKVTTLCSITGNSVEPSKFSPLQDHDINTLVE